MATEFTDNEYANSSRNPEFMSQAGSLKPEILRDWYNGKTVRINSNSFNTPAGFKAALLKLSLDETKVIEISGTIVRILNGSVIIEVANVGYLQLNCQNIDHDPGIQLEPHHGDVPNDILNSFEP